MNRTLKKANWRLFVTSAGCALFFCVVLSVLVLLSLLQCPRLSHFGGLLRPHGASIALGHRREQGLKENPSQDEVKKEDDQDCRHSLKEEFSQLVNNFLH